MRTESSSLAYPLEPMIFRDIAANGPTAVSVMTATSSTDPTATMREAMFVTLPVNTVRATAESLSTVTTTESLISKA